MPLIESAIKRARQSLVRRARLQPVRTKMKTLIKKYVEFIKDGKHEEAGKLLPQVFKAIDMAAKKGIIHRKNAGHKKSLMSRMAAKKKK